MDTNPVVWLDLYEPVCWLGFLYHFAVFDWLSRLIFKPLNASENNIQLGILPVVIGTKFSNHGNLFSPSVYSKDLVNSHPIIFYQYYRENGTQILTMFINNSSKAALLNCAALSTSLLSSMYKHELSFVRSITKINYSSYSLKAQPVIIKKA